MKITFLVIGKTKDKALIALEEEYLKRLQAFCKIDYKVIPNITKSSKLSIEEFKREEKEAILSVIESNDFLLSLDEKGDSLSSKDFSNWVKKHLSTSRTNLVILVGGAYGFHEEIKKRSNFSLSLSKMTFSHQMVRTLFLEQFYRAFSILNNKPYHH